MTNAPQPTPVQKLQRLAQRFLDDSAAQADDRKKYQDRAAALPALQAIIREFIAGSIGLPELRQQLNVYLLQHNYWETGYWQMVLNKLVSYHGTAGEELLRRALTGLDHTTYPQHLEQLITDLNQERQRLDGQGRQRASPGDSAFFLGVFALWLDPDSDMLVPWRLLRDGLKSLNDHHALPHTAGLKVTEKQVQIRTPAEYAAVGATVTAIARTVPELAGSGPSWAERFTTWIAKHQASIPAWLATTDETEDSSVSNRATLAPNKEDDMVFPDEPLRAIEPAVLAERITELRRELLIDKDVIERIYHTLVMGRHVILSGPPGTGKTDLATRLPAVLWQTTEPAGVSAVPFTTSHTRIEQQLTTKTSYAVRIETATDEWTPRHVIGGIAPALDGDTIRYEIVPGCLTATLLANWELDEDDPASWAAAQRRPYLAAGTAQPYRGLWLVIDEFNRAPIDLALGEALTAIGGGAAALTVPTQGGPQRLALPKDFRIIGTLNSFDRHFLNQISEALKRRFAFIELLPPTRSARAAEQGTVVRAALKARPAISWGQPLSDILEIQAGTDPPWTCVWQGSSAVEALFDEGWRFFEVLRVFRQFGTAQAISWASLFLGAGLLQSLAWDDEAGWRHCLSTALADTLADQLQILLPDEIEVLLAYLRNTTAADFATRYGVLLGRLISPKRRTAQMLALQSIRDDQGQPLITPEDATRIADDERTTVPDAVLAAIFHTAAPRGRLRDVEERLDRFLFERTI